jgi:hypothetical protein
MRRRHLLALASLAFALGPAAARAQFPGLTLTFLQPTGTGSPTDAFEVWVRLALDPTAPAPLTFDGTAAAPFGLPPAFIPTIGYHLSTNLATSAPFASFTYVQTISSTFCTSTFFDCFPGAPYAFDFNPASGYDFNQTFTLLPGESLDYLFGTYTPTPPGAPPGTYRLFDAHASLRFDGVDASGEAMYTIVALTRTCPTNDPTCAFTRTVLATVPEPGAVVLVATGLVGIGWLSRRRRG